MIIESMTSLAVGKIRGGKLKNLENVNLKGWYLFILGFLLEFVSVFLAKDKTGQIYEILSNYFVYIHALSYIIISIGLIMNFDKKSMMIFFIGHILNFAVIMANNGQMPVSGDGLRNLGLINHLKMLQDNSILTHTLVNEYTKLTFLGDVIPIPRPYPLPKMISVGDIFIIIAIFMFIQGAMFAKNKNDKYEFDIKS